MPSHDKMVAGMVQKIIHGKAHAKPAPKAAFKRKTPLFAKRVDTPKEESAEPAKTPEAGEREVHIHVHLPK